jgi:hypothetical protein
MEVRELGVVSAFSASQAVVCLVEIGRTGQLGPRNMSQRVLIEVVNNSMHKRRNKIRHDKEYSEEGQAGSFFELTHVETISLERWYCRSAESYKEKECARRVRTFKPDFHYSPQLANRKGPLICKDKLVGCDDARMVQTSTHPLAGRPPNGVGGLLYPAQEKANSLSFIPFARKRSLC